MYFAFAKLDYFDQNDGVMEQDSTNANKEDVFETIESINSGKCIILTDIFFNILHYLLSILFAIFYITFLLNKLQKLNRL